MCLTVEETEATVTWSMVGQLAHQGGWDEALFVAIPIVVFGVLLAVANRRPNHE